MIYLFLSSTLSAFLLMEFVNLFLLLKMGLIVILALRVLHDLLLNDLWGVILSWELVLLWAATYGLGLGLGLGLVARGRVLGARL